MTDEQAVALIHAIREHSGLELSSLRDAATYGADSGFGGFTYTADGADFTRANADLLDTLLQEAAEEFGFENVAALVATFKRADMTDTRDGFDCLVSWWAIEEAGRWLVDRKEAPRRGKPTRSLPPFAEARL